MVAKIIEGRRYNTKTATRLHEWDNGHYGRDFKSCAETLYRTANGAYFLVGSGGPMSKYAVHRGNSVYGDDDVFTPLSRELALDWAERHGMDAEVIEIEFGDMISDPEPGPGRPPLHGEAMTQITITIPAEMAAWLDQQPENNRSATVRRLIAEGMQP